MFLAPKSAGCAPRPIEAAQPEPVRRDWALHRANTWGKLACPGRIVHYAELSKLLIEHANHLARCIDQGEHITAAAVTPSYRWRLAAERPGFSPEFPALAGGSAQVLLAAPYMILCRLTPRDRLRHGRACRWQAKGVCRR
jgi:hypothetical protein